MAWNHAANVEVSHQPFADLAPALHQTVEGPTPERNGLTTVLAELDRYGGRAELPRFLRYPTLSKVAVTRLARAVRVVAEPLSAVAGKVVANG